MYVGEVCWWKIFCMLVNILNRNLNVCWWSMLVKNFMYVGEKHARKKYKFHQHAFFTNILHQHKNCHKNNLYFIWAPWKKYLKDQITACDGKTFICDTCIRYSMKWCDNKCSTKMSKKSSRIIKQWFRTTRHKFLIFRDLQFVEPD